MKTTGKITIETLEQRNEDGKISLLGFHQEWVSGGDGEVDCKLSHGVGNPYLQLSVTLKDGTVVHECADVRPLLKKWVDRILADRKKEAK